jgi:hypothetical protein
MSTGWAFELEAMLSKRSTLSMANTYRLPLFIATPAGWVSLSTTTRTLRLEPSSVTS